MRIHKHVEMPEDVFPIDDWELIQCQFDPNRVAETETIFALSNGYLGTRGGHEEGRPSTDDGTLSNGFFEYRPIVYPEEAYGFPRMGQTIIYVPEGKIIRLYVDDEPVDLATSEILTYRRSLDMRAGVLRRDVCFLTTRGKRVQVTSTRLVSLRRRHLLATSYEVRLPDEEADIDICSELVCLQPDGEPVSDDPRKAPLFSHQVLAREHAAAEGLRSIQCYRTQLSQFRVACGMARLLETACEHDISAQPRDDGHAVLIHAKAEAGSTIRLSKYLTYFSAQTADVAELCGRVEVTLARARRSGCARLETEQRVVMDRFWHDSNVEDGGVDPRAQQVIHWNLFQLLQASARVEGHSIEYVSALAAPVFDYRGELVLSLALFGFKSGFDVGWGGRNAQLLRRTADSISERLGYVP